MGHKFPLVWGSFVVAMLCSALFGYATAGSVWMLVAVTVLAATLLGEVRRAVIRRRCRGEPPVEQENAGISLAHPVTTTDLVLARYELLCPAWRGRDLRIVHIGDLHLDHHLPLLYYESAMRRVAASHPDLVFVTGDFVTERQFVPMIPEVLGIARGRLGTFAVLGNHDYWAGAQEVADAVRSAGVTLLGDGCASFPVENGAVVQICGYQGPWGPAEWSEPATTPGGLSLVLTHTPDNIYRVSRSGVTAVFAGHYHGGQVRIPGFGSLVVPSNYGRLFDHGHFVIRGNHTACEGTHLFVTAGIGSALPPVRIYCPPDVFIVDIRRST
jgi:predicted MPP superfamily phosphohydrolase